MGGYQRDGAREQPRRCPRPVCQAPPSAPGVPGLSLQGLSQPAGLTPPPKPQTDLLHGCTQDAIALVTRHLHGAQELDVKALHPAGTPLAPYGVTRGLG